MSLVLLVGFAVSIGQFRFVNSLPQARNKIEGAVSAADHRPLSEMRVFLQNDAYSHIATAITDPTGRFRYNERRGGGGEVFRLEFVLSPKGSPKAANTGSAPKDKNVVFYQPVPETARNEYLRAVKSLEKDDFRDAAASLNSGVRESSQRNQSQDLNLFWPGSNCNPELVRCDWHFTAAAARAFFRRQGRAGSLSRRERRLLSCRRAPFSSTCRAHRQHARGRLSFRRA